MDRELRDRVASFLGDKVDEYALMEAGTYSEWLQLLEDLRKDNDE